MSIYKPYDGKESTVWGVKTVFTPQGRISNQIKVLINIKGSKSRGVISFFIQGENKVGITLKNEDLIEFLKLL